VSKGSGENVKFREQALAFDETIQTTASSWTLTKTLRLDSLGMEKGDELYFFVEGWDRRSPDPNRGRSETFFVVLRDTSRWAVSSDLGLRLNPADEYLRSQRQIIIDTEKLIEEKQDISQVDFKQRSNDLGIDQKVLRLRYGQFLGEEFESTVTHAERLVPGEGADDTGEEEHDQEQALPPGVPIATSDQAVQEILNEYAHLHDTEEGATFYSEDIKRELKAALAEMWEAELRLRTYRPEDALPYEYRALRILKALQQKARIYVKRIGFEPPPLKPEETRLTGDLDEVQNRRSQRERQADVSFPAIREALVLLQPTEPNPVDAAHRVAVLERAGRELAGVAIEQPGRYLSALRNLRVLIDDLETGRGWCRPCSAVIRQVFWNMLPPAEALPRQREENATSLTRRYFKEMGR
ncbi:MAG: tryptophan-rich sensory protein, partial [Rhodothermales bacterium]